MTTDAILDCEGTTYIRGISEATHPHLVNEIWTEKGTEIPAITVECLGKIEMSNHTPMFYTLLGQN